MGSGGGHNRWLPLRAPGLAVLCGYRRSWLRGDLIAGVTVAAYLVPQVMAYAGVAGLPPVTGLWAALPPLACYAMLGSSRLVSLGPDATTALMTAVAIGPLAAGPATDARHAGPGFPASMLPIPARGCGRGVLPDRPGQDRRDDQRRGGQGG
jgi:MFS superfamily sulfate permease-like transporter